MLSTRSTNWASPPPKAILDAIRPQKITQPSFTHAIPVIFPVRYLRFKAKKWYFEEKKAIFALIQKIKEMKK